jgi:hypothetical protein
MVIRQPYQRLGTVHSSMWNVIAGKLVIGCKPSGGDLCKGSVLATLPGRDEGGALAGSFMRSTH